MPKDLTIILKDHPGILAMVGETLGKAGVNIEGICGMAFEDKAIVHILVQDIVKTRQILEANQIPVSGGLEVLVLKVDDQPSTLRKVARQLANAGVNIYLIYLATASRLVIGVNDIEKARSILKLK
ncbi:MAG TPA: hypothetical protein VMS73_10430 [Anaerolineaceae bacterium]|nr:hypothetical protein [Anaerolineaceae bacterium]